MRTTTGDGASTALAGVLGMASALCAGLTLAVDTTPETLTPVKLLLRLLCMAAAGAGAAVVLHRWLLTPLFLRKVAGEQARVARRQALTFAVFLGYAVEAGGLRFPPGVLSLTLWVLFSSANLGLYLWSRPGGDEGARASLGFAFLFFLSGFAALIYQVAWQRALFAVVGVNIESVTLVVTAFMLGLGLGAWLGGQLTHWFPAHLAHSFLACELGVGAFGALSLAAIHAVGNAVTAHPPWVAGVAVFVLLVPPTVLMGATLPLLATHLHRALKHLGRSVSLLYFFNTLGSALACWWTAHVLFVFWGLSGAVHFAAACNLVVGVLVFAVIRLTAPKAAVHAVQG